jgi:hypothetical protein
MPLDRMIAVEPNMLTIIRIAHFLHEGRLRGSAISSEVVRFAYQ